MQIHCLGTVGYHPNPTRHTSSYFLPVAGILLDAGSGVFRLPELIQTDRIDILLSHAHLDHTMGLTFLLDVLFQRPIKQLRIWGEAAKLDAIQQHLFHELIFPVALDAEWISIDDRPEFQIDDASVTWRPQSHPGGSVAYRIDWPIGKRLVYATDTTGDTGAGFAEWSQNADLMIHECYFRNPAAQWADATGHSWTQRVADVAIAAKPVKLMLTHINPLELGDDPVDVDSIRAQIESEVVVAWDTAVVEF